MININVDEGYAYDFLAILEVKNKKFKNQLSENTYKKCFEFIKNQIGSEKHDEIINSIEYKNLIKFNLKTFDIVEKARYGNASAKEVDNCNMERYKSKVKLQNKFFKNSSMTEVKS